MLNIHQDLALTLSLLVFSASPVAGTVRWEDSIVPLQPSNLKTGAVLIATNEMKTIYNPKKTASHAGVAPFEYCSISSVRGWADMSQHYTGLPARKPLKSLFHLGVMSVIQVKGELQNYYQLVHRCGKVKEGKNKIGPPMRLILNAVRNKLTHRIYAVVK